MTVPHRTVNGALPALRHVATALGLSLVAGAPAGAVEAHYLECRRAQPDASEPGSFHLKVDRGAREMVRAERTGEGLVRRERFRIVATTAHEIVGRAMREGEPVYLALDRSTFEWRLELPVPREHNRNTWNASQGRMGYPDWAQLYREATGSCVAAGPGGHGSASHL